MICFMWSFSSDVEHSYLTRLVVAMMVKTRSSHKVAEVALANGRFHMDWTLRERALTVDPEWIDHRVKSEASIIENSGTVEVGRCSRRENDK